MTYCHDSRLVSPRVFAHCAWASQTHGIFKAMGDSAKPSLEPGAGALPRPMRAIFSQFLDHGPMSSPASGAHALSAFLSFICRLGAQSIMPEADLAPAAHSSFLIGIARLQEAASDSFPHPPQPQMRAPLPSGPALGEHPPLPGQSPHVSPAPSRKSPKPSNPNKPAASQRSQGPSPPGASSLR